MLAPDLKTVFFDLDDTLVFSEPMHKKSWEMVLTNLHQDSSHIDFERLVGLPEIEAAKFFIRFFDMHESPAFLVQQKRELFLMFSEEGFESALGRNNFLKNLSSLCQIGLVSASPRIVIEKVLAVEKISSFFNFIIGYEDSTKHKPDPMPYQNALAWGGFNPNQALVIEDSVAGITSGLTAGISVFGLLKNQLSDQIVKNVPYFNNFDEINNTLFGK